MKYKRHIINILLLVFFLTGWDVTSLHADTLSSREYKLKAGLMYNLAKFVEYPVSSENADPGNFIIGILGEDPFGNEINVLNEKTVQERIIKIERYHSIHEMKECHMLFVCVSEKLNTASVLDRIKGKSILTISDMEGFAEIGGMINFVTVNNRICFNVNLSSAQKAGLKLSAHFLKLTTVVEQ